MSEQAVKAPVIVEPTVGRTVHYYPFVSEAMATDPGPRAAIIAKVHSDRRVNLAVFDQNGVTSARTSVCLLQEGDPVPTRESYCTFLPKGKR